MRDDRNDSCDAPVWVTVAMMLIYGAALFAAGYGLGAGLLE